MYLTYQKRSRKITKYKEKKKKNTIIVSIYLVKAYGKLNGITIWRVLLLHEIRGRIEEATENLRNRVPMGSTLVFTPDSAWLCTTTALYGSKTRVLNARGRRRGEVFDMKCLRRTL